MRQLTINPNNRQYYSEDFIKGFNCGAQRQFEADKSDADRPQGEWIADKHKNIWDMDVDCYRCSNCGSRAINHSLIMDITGLSYCPNCGARMKGADDE